MEPFGAAESSVRKTPLFWLIMACLLGLLNDPAHGALSSGPAWGMGWFKASITSQGRIEWEEATSLRQDALHDLAPSRNGLPLTPASHRI